MLYTAGQTINKMAQILGFAETNLQPSSTKSEKLLQ
jgi:hypothetical protein